MNATQLEYAICSFNISRNSRVLLVSCSLGRRDCGGFVLALFLKVRKRHGSYP